jgi:alpha-L-fucosidase
MKNIYILVTLYLFISCFACKKPVKSTSVSYSRAETPEVKIWKDNKLGMMVHFGLYSMLGGMYHGQPVTKGYSEQIMAHAPIPAEEYKSMAASFNPTAWNADSLVELALRGGFRTIVITAKHHDGFNMYDTQESDFSITKATPFKRDVLRELSDACSKSRMGLGIYFSLIDWNAKAGATTISSHNADTISPELHQSNLKQIKELCSNYGTVSEMWFDMGFLTKAQSTEIRALVKNLQPNCMIGSRIGNGQGDFEVLGDNQLPDYRLDCPWQAVASIYPNTWGYRSWQEKGDVNKKTSEILKNLNLTLVKGGNYMLNVGPDGSGTVPAFEAEVINKAGEWIKANGEAIYNNRPFPYGEKSWGAATYNPPMIYAHITSLPDQGKLFFYGLNNELTSAVTLLPPNTPLSASLGGVTTQFDLGLVPLKFDPSTIIAIKYEGDLNVLPAKKVAVNNDGKYELSYYNANVSWAQDGANYYSTVPTVTHLSWDLANVKEADAVMTIYYTQQEKNKVIQLKINDHTERIDLNKYKTFRQIPLNMDAVPSTIYTQGPYDGLDMNTHPGLITYTTPSERFGNNGVPWKEVLNLEQGQYVQLEPAPMQSYYYLMNILCSKPMNWIFALGSDDAFSAYLNGKLIYAAGYPQEGNNTVFLDLPLIGESNTLILKHLNVKGGFKTFYSMKADQIHFEKEVTYTTLIPKINNHIEISLADPDHPNENLGTPNIKIVVQAKKK